MTNSAHFARELKQKAVRQNIKHQAFKLAHTKIQAYDIEASLQITELYQQIDHDLVTRFKGYHQYRIARQGFLRAVREYNKTHQQQLDEPVVPIAEGRDTLTIGYDWFVLGTEVSTAVTKMLDIWQTANNFSTRDKVKYLLYSSIMIGGLSGIDALRALYEWLFGARTLYQITLTPPDQPHKSLAIIPLVVNDARYGCLHEEASLLQRHVNFVPDPISLMFLYSLQGSSLKRTKNNEFDTLIHELNKTLVLTQRDRNKPHLSHLIKYADFHWRNLPHSAIDGAGTLVMQGKTMTTALPIAKLISYNREILARPNTQTTLLQWSALFEHQARSQVPLKEPKTYPAFSKNIIKSIQDALKLSKPQAIREITTLLASFPQPNATRLLEWTLSLLNDGKSNNQSISKYIGSIGRDWLMLTMNEDLDLWEAADYAEVYEQILEQKQRDRRKTSLLYQMDNDDPEPALDEAHLDESLLGVTEDGNAYGDSHGGHNHDNNDGDNTNSNDDLTNSPSPLPPHSHSVQNKSFVKGRLYAFHEFQKKQYKDAYDAPKLSFARHDSAQVVKANMISPKVYHAMQAYLQQAAIDDHQRQLCSSIIAVAYRTGMRLNELVGIKVADIETGPSLNVILRPNRYRRLKSSSARRRIPLIPLLKPHELNGLTQLIARQQVAGRTYLFSQGVGNTPLPSHFFTNLLRLLLDAVLGEDKHDYTFHSLRHTALSQLALVLCRSPLTYAMTDYSASEVNNIRQALLGHHQIQGAWVGLASLAGHLTCDTTFEHYIHTAHLLAGEQLNQATLTIPFALWQNITNIDYQSVHYFNKEAYHKADKTVNLTILTGYLLRKLKAHHHPLFTDQAMISAKNEAKNDASTDTHAHVDPADRLELEAPSIFIHAKYQDALALLKDLAEINPEQREAHVVPLGIKHGIYAKEAKRLLTNAEQLNSNGKLIIKPRGQRANDLISIAMDRAYQMSVDRPKALQRLVMIYQQKHITSNAYLHFGIKASQRQLLAEFMGIACQLIDAQHWQIRSTRLKDVQELKKLHQLDPRIQTGVREHFKGFEVRVVMQAKCAQTGDSYLKSSGVLKFVGEALVCLVGIDDGIGE